MRTVVIGRPIRLERFRKKKRKGGRIILMDCYGQFNL
jgi:hypothetical protein